MDLDKTDVKILKILLENARLSHRQIAKKVKVSVGTVIAKIQKMERSGIIHGYSALVDYENLGYDLTIITEIIVSKGKLLDVEKEIAKIPNTCAVYDVTGTTDAIVIAKFKNRKTLSEFTKTVLSLPFVERTNSHVVLTIVKEDYTLL
jgi:DNA-binding Lrp family transcriptional regulator